MVVGFTTTYEISAYHHWCCEFESRSGGGVQHYMIKFVNDFRWFSPGPPVSSINKNYWHDITEILLKVALNTIKQNNKQQTNIEHSKIQSIPFLVFFVHFLLTCEFRGLSSSLDRYYDRGRWLCLNPDFIIVVLQWIWGKSNSIMTTHSWCHQTMLSWELTYKYKKITLDFHLSNHVYILFNLIPRKQINIIQLLTFVEVNIRIYLGTIDP